MNELIGLVGIARKAQKIVIGDQVIKAITSNSAKLVLIDEEIGQNSRKKLINKCSFYRVEYHFVESELFIKVFGSSSRKSLAVIDEGFAKKIQSCMKG